MARLLGYRWPAELDPEMELSDEARAWVKRCDELLSFADDDGIVCIPPVRGEARLADQSAQPAGRRLRRRVDRRTSSANCSSRPTTRASPWRAGCGTSSSCSTASSSTTGPSSGTSGTACETALPRWSTTTSSMPNCWRRLIYTYLGDWISRQKDDIRNGVDGAEEKLAAAESLKKRLELILEGEAPYDIFVRWKPLEKQPIGWDPDLNDGVRLNIRPFMSVPDVGKKGAGVLREKPNINWNKDRGKDVESAPWYHLFKGDRINDYHLKLDRKGKGHA